MIGLTGASCEDGVLGVRVPPAQRRHFADLLTLTGVYHDFDYGLFCMNIRANAIDRARSYRLHASEVDRQSRQR